MASYGQRDPLIMYKSQAVDLFRTLLSDIRMRVITNMFTTRPQRSQVANVERPAAAQAAESDAGEEAKKASSGKKRRKRH